jgi:hypothetical protein
MPAYRYVGAAETLWIRENGDVVSRSGTTWYAVGNPPPLTSRTAVQDAYALPDLPEYAVGPIPDDECPIWNVVGPRTVFPQRLPGGRWVPGGGTEAATRDTLRLLRLRKLN